MMIRYAVTLVRSVRQYRQVIVEAPSPYHARRRALAYARGDNSVEDTAAGYSQKNEEEGEWLNCDFSAPSVHELDVAEPSPKKETG